jgi:type IV pilus assembly protein PilE
MRAQQRGMTLIELMTVVVVLAILASLAVPSYRNYLLRAQRTEATTALLRLQAAQEKFYLQNNAYTDDVDGDPPAGLGLAAVTERGFYAIDVDLAADGQSYEATATPVAGGGQADDTRCTEFSVNNAGERGAEGTGGLDLCWR